MITQTLITTGAIYGLILLVYVTTVFLFAQAKADNSVMDIFYGPAFAVATWSTIWITQTFSLPAIVGAGLVTLWATRLALRIARKNWGAPEDARYAAWRNEWMQRGSVYFIIRSYLQINLLQGVIIWLVSLPMILIIADPALPLHWTMLLGAVLFFAGLIYETAADWQLDSFIARKKAGMTEQTLMTTGLFALSRRPNYFGEALLWWGLAMMAATAGWGMLAFVSPLLITYILTQVTGPMLERQFLERYPEAYRAYMETTPYFVPFIKS